MKISFKDLEEEYLTIDTGETEGNVYFDDIKEVVKELPEHKKRVLLLRAAGYTLKEIAKLLGVSISTVHYLVENIKLEIKANLDKKLK